jgi:arylsulfatase A-like enzyme
MKIAAVVTVVVLFALAGFLTGAQRGRPAHPNVVLISVDGCRADHLSSYGCKNPTSPNIDLKAREGVSFLNSYSQANESLMSHASLLSGRYPGEIAPMTYMAYALPPSLATLQKLLKTEGYATGAFTGGGHVAHNYGFGNGFDTYWDGIHFGTFYESVPRALDWLEAHRDQPTFTFLHGYDCHRPYRKPPVFGHLYDPDYRGDADRYLVDTQVLDRVFDGVYYGDFQLRHMWTSTGDRPIDPTNYEELAKHHDEYHGTPLSARDMEHLRAHYDGAVTYADTWMGVFFAGLARLGFDSSNTLIVIIADHGEDLMEHGTFNHRVGLQTANIHVPLIFWGAGVTARGQRFSGVTENVDVVPTVLSMVGVPIPRDVRGHDLSPWLDGRRTDPGDDRAAFSEGILAMASMTSGTHELIVRDVMTGTQDMLDVLDGKNVGRARIELYDLAKDPDELHPVTDDPREAPVLAALRKKMYDIEQIEVGLKPVPQHPDIDPALNRHLRKHGYPAPDDP